MNGVPARWITLVLAAALVAVAACSAGATQSANTLVLGAIYPLTGPQAPGGRDELAGVQTALQLAQQQGVFGSRQVRLQVISAETPEQASAAVDRLIDQYHVPAIIGTYGSTLAVSSAARASQRHVVYWETGAVADGVTIGHPYVFRTVATGSNLGHLAVQFTNGVLLPRNGVTPAQARVVIVAVDDVYGHSVADAEASDAAKDGIDVVDRIDYSPSTVNALAIAQRMAADRADYLWDVSYVDDGIAIWQAVLAQGLHLKAAVGTSSAFCMPEFGQRLGAQAIGLYAADKPDEADIDPSVLSAPARALQAQAAPAYAKRDGGQEMSISGVAGFVGGWALFHGVLGTLHGAVTPDAISTAAYALNEPVYSSINGGGVRFGRPGTPDAGQNLLAPSVVGQWQAVNTMRVVYPAPFASSQPVTMDSGSGDS